MNLAEIVDAKNEIRTEYGFDELITVKLTVKVTEHHLNSVLGFRVSDIHDIIIFTSEIKTLSHIKEQGVYTFEVKLPNKLLVPNTYKLTFGLHIPNIIMIEHLKECLSFDIIETGSDFHIYGGADYGRVFVNCPWRIINKDK